MHTVPETAKRLRVSVSTVWRLIKSGRLGAIKVTAGSVRVPDEELNRFIEESKVRPLDASDPARPSDVEHAALADMDHHERMRVVMQAAASTLPAAPSTDRDRDTA